MSDQGKVILYRVVVVAAAIGFVGWGIELFLRGAHGGPWQVVSWLTLVAFVLVGQWTRPARVRAKSD